MKVKILSSNNKSTWYNRYINNQIIDVYYDIRLPKRCFTGKNGNHCLFNDDVVITELPESFCVKRCDDGIKWGKYIDWLNKTYNTDFCGRLFKFDNPSDYPYYGVIDDEGQGIKIPFGTEIHIDDMIKHIDYMESQQHINGGEQLIAKLGKIIKEKEFDLTTNERRLAYARKYYPIGTRFKALNCVGDNFGESKSEYEPKLWEDRGRKGIETSLHGLVYSETTNQWAEIIKEEENMETQKLSRQGLKEIHGVACSSWKLAIETFGLRNPLEDYIELTQEEVNQMFDACTKNQLPIVSKYLKQDDGSVDLSNFTLTDTSILQIRIGGENENKAFLLSPNYDWKIQKDEYGVLCLIPTK